MEIKVATINILNELSVWSKRRNLLRDGLAALQPDLICLQEVSLAANNAAWLAEELGYALAVCPKTGDNPLEEGVAVLSRLPVVNKECFNLGSQNRVALGMIFPMQGREFVLVNGHYFWEPGESSQRLRQVERLLEWLPGFAGERPVIVCGDFNGTPETTAIVRMRQSFVSAYAVVHGEEPEYTCPTPLRIPLKHYLKTLKFMFTHAKFWKIKPGWHGTLDYIFTSPAWKVRDCQVVLNQPAPDDPGLYPSDHFGLYAEMEL